jgi:hypothetical protein
VVDDVYKYNHAKCISRLRDKDTQILIIEADGACTNYCALRISIVVGFEVITAVVMNISIFWDITPCSPLRVNQRFGGTFRLHLQGSKLATYFTLVFLLGLFFDTEDVGDMFLRNFG